MGVKSGYKQTEVGLIPDDWELKALQDVFTLKSGFAFSSEHFSKVGPIVLTPGNFLLEGGLYFEDRNTKRYSGTYSSKMTFSRGDLLIVMTDLTPDCNLLGKPAVVQSDEVILHNQRIGKVVLRDKSLELPLLFYMLLSRPYLARIREQAVGSTVRHTSSKSIYSAQLPWPPLREQFAIAEALSDVDALIGALERLIAKKRDLKQASMQLLLTGQTRLPGFQGEWGVTTLLKLAGGKKELFDDGDWIESEHITSQGVRLVQTGNIGIGRFLEKDDRKYIYEASFTSLRCKQLRTGDLLVCRLAEPAGRACVFPDIGEEKVVTSVDVTICRPPCEVVNRTYLANLFSTPEWFRKVSDRSGGTTHKRVSRGALGRIQFELPPLPEQTAIAAVLTDMDAELTALEQRLAKTRTLKQGMMQELLTGRTRLL